jgi:PEP-CTERM motif
VLGYSSQSVRRRRSRRNRHLRGRFAALVLLTFVFLAGFVLTHRHYFGLFSSSSSYAPQSSSSSELAALVTRLVSSATPKNHLIYPYSLIPGGVQDAVELRQAADRDPVVAQHYADFDYSRATVTEVREPELVYVSYRMKDEVYWTKKRIALHKGEKLITDGKTTARARCGNQVSSQPKAEISPEEPPEVVFEQPLNDGGGTAVQAPETFASLANGGGKLVPGNPPNVGGVYSPGVGGGVPPFAAPPLPLSSCDKNNKKKPCPPTAPGPPSPVPEPATMALMASGLAGIYWKYRKSA